MVSFTKTLGFLLMAGLAMAQDTGGRFIVTAALIV